MMCENFFHISEKKKNKKEDFESYVSFYIS
ncbi:hypothetical protein PFFVO_04200 [Plasmodium falciparum Vietnam Oak-Knoll (FVO)]|uniref:Uncharacterized protein n=1 Tax=Plasmodium falciparum Vietnam Oak-Knoll (FVO) TaxID=1036723 RepID=A0A024V3X9_PLAFA|nr:hypothetical protein PFFVO_04200 [Plasmodium falciparum Vietnam Oak-Knoll (FVO)]